MLQLTRAGAPMCLVLIQAPLIACGPLPSKHPVSTVWKGVALCARARARAYASACATLAPACPCPTDSESKE